MTARVMLPFEDLHELADTEWLADLLAFDVSPTAGWQISARVQMLVFLVRLYAPGARNIGRTAWPTPGALAILTGLPQEQVLHLVTIADAAGFLVYADDAPALETPAEPTQARPTARAATSARSGASKAPRKKRSTKATDAPRAGSA